MLKKIHARNFYIHTKRKSIKANIKQLLFNIHYVLKAMANDC